MRQRKLSLITVLNLSFKQFSGYLRGVTFPLVKAHPSLAVSSGVRVIRVDHYFIKSATIQPSGKS